MCQVTVQKKGRDVRGSRPCRIDGEANASETSSAVAAAAAGNVERYRNDVSLLHVKYIAASFNHFACYFVAEDKASGGGGATANLS